jgi:hypothetical protein
MHTHILVQNGMQIHDGEAGKLLLPFQELPIQQQH